MATADNQSLESQLRRLDCQSRVMWRLALALLVLLCAALATLQLAGGTWDTPLSPENRYLLVVALSGTVALFSLYMVHKQRQLQAARETALRAALREASLRSRLTSLSSFFDRVSQATTQLELEPILQALAEHLRVSLAADHASLMLLDAEARELRPSAVAGADPEGLRDARIPLGTGVVGMVAVTREALALDAAEIARRFPMPREPFRTASAGLCVPLAVGDQVIGVLNVVRFDSGAPFPVEDARLVSVFAAHVGIALKRIHERRQAEEALYLREEQLKQAQRMEALGRLAGGIAHDFNNLMTVIQACGRHLVAAPGACVYGCGETGRKIMDAAVRCTALTRQLLTFSRRQVFERVVLDLNQAVRDSADLLARMLGESIELKIALDPALDSIRADRVQIEQVLMNLAINARDAMPHGGWLTVETAGVRLDEVAALERNVAPGCYATLRVRDTGEGMDTETLQHAFEPFFTTKRSGTGLGLATVYGIVSQSGGFIRAESKPGTGTTFEIHLPCAERKAEVPAVDGQRRPDRAPRGTILLVEDEEPVRAVVREMLEGGGFAVLEAGLAGEAVMLAEEHEGGVDLLVTDVVLPGESGGDLAQWMAQRWPGIPVLYISGYANDDVVCREVLRNGAAFLQKPFDETDLLERVCALIGRTRADADSAETGQAAA